MGTCPRTAQPPRLGPWAAPWSVTSPAGTSSTSISAAAAAPPPAAGSPGTAGRAHTGFPRADGENAFLRIRRRQVLARLAGRLRRGPDDVNLILPYDEVVAALGFRGEEHLGLRTIKLDAVVGTVDSRRDFDRRFRPPTTRG